MFTSGTGTGVSAFACAFAACDNGSEFVLFENELVSFCRGGSLCLRCLLILYFLGFFLAMQSLNADPTFSLATSSPT